MIILQFCVGRRTPVQVRGSHASDTTNTYGTSVWGSSSKGKQEQGAPFNTSLIGLEPEKCSPVADLIKYLYL